MWKHSGCLKTSASVENLERYSVLYVLRVANFVSPKCFPISMRHSVNRPPTPDTKDYPPQLTLHEIINLKMLESGEKERLMELLRERLVDCGWKGEMEALCRELVKEKGKNNVTVTDLVHVITPKGRASIPASIKHELLRRIQTFLASTAL